MLNGRVLVVHLQQDLGDMISHALSQRGLHTITADAAFDDLERDTLKTCDLVIIDADYDQEGILNLCTNIRTVFKGPLLVSTYEQGEPFQLRLYWEGVDECIRKPVGIPLFLAKVTAWLRRSMVEQSPISTVSDTEFQLDTVQRLLTTPDGKTARLSELECRLFQVMLTNRGQILASSHLIDRVWIEYDDGDAHQLKNLVYRLRRKIEPEPSTPRYIRTIAGHGYCLNRTAHSPQRDNQRTRYEVRASQDACRHLGRQTEYVFPLFAYPYKFPRAHSFHRRTLSPSERPIYPVSLRPRNTPSRFIRLSSSLMSCPARRPYLFVTDLSPPPTRTQALPTISPVTPHLHCSRSAY